MIGRRRDIRSFSGPPRRLAGAKDSQQEMVERHGVVREMIKHEDHLNAGRIGRMLTAQALLFSAIIFSDDPILTDVIVPIIGIAFAWISVGNLWFANKALDSLSDWWLDAYPEQKYLPDVKGYREERRVVRWIFSERLLPVFLVIGWAAILYVGNCEKLMDKACRPHWVFELSEAQSTAFESNGDKESTVLSHGGTEE